MQLALARKRICECESTRYFDETPIESSLLALAPPVIPERPVPRESFAPRRNGSPGEIAGERSFARVRN